MMNQEEARDVFRRHDLHVTPFVREDVAAALMKLEQETATLRTRVAEEETERNANAVALAAAVIRADRDTARAERAEARVAEVERKLDEQRARITEALARDQLDLRQSREREAGTRRALETLRASVSRAAATIIRLPKCAGDRRTQEMIDRDLVADALLKLQVDADRAAALAPAPATEGNSSAGLTGSPAPEPFCACGRVGSRCDSSRVGCHGPEKRCRITSKDVRDPTCTRCRTREAQP